MDDNTLLVMNNNYTTKNGGLVIKGKLSINSIIMKFKT